jgi:hypothetical protein
MAAEAADIGILRQRHLLTVSQRTLELLGLFPVGREPDLAFFPGGQKNRRYLRRRTATVPPRFLFQLSIRDTLNTIRLLPNHSGMDG